jgi:hypothetical protein
MTIDALKKAAITLAVVLVGLFVWEKYLKAKVA